MISYGKISCTEAFLEGMSEKEFRLFFAKSGEDVNKAWQLYGKYCKKPAKKYSKKKSEEASDEATD